jgi:hypothetical protein
MFLVFLGFETTHYCWEEKCEAKRVKLREYFTQPFFRHSDILDLVTVIQVSPSLP